MSLAQILRNAVPSIYERHQEVLTLTENSVLLSHDELQVILGLIEIKQFYGF